MFKLNKNMNTPYKNTDFYTDQWLKNQGLDPASFIKEEVNFLRAKIITHELLGKQRDLLEAPQIEQLEVFKRLVRDPKYRPTDKVIFQILNLGKKVHRRIYRDRKKVQALRNT
jgi:hypothetical protein